MSRNIPAQVNEDSTPKRCFKRRRVFATAAALLVLTVAGVIGLLIGESAAPVKAKFVGFSTSSNGPVVVLRVTNESARAFILSSLNNFETVVGGFRGRSSNDFVVNFEPKGSPMYSLPFAPHSESNCQVRLPMDGGVGWPAVQCVFDPTPGSDFRGRIKKLWWRIRPPGVMSLKFTWAVCDQEIHCPKSLPNGAIEPPRLVSQP